MTDPKSASKIDHLIEHLVGFLETKSEILKLELKEELVRIGARLFATFIIILLVMLVVFFFSMALGNYLNELWQSAYLGFLALGVLFLLFGVAMLILKNSSWYQGIMWELTERLLESRNNQDEDRSEDQKAGEEEAGTL